MSYYGSTPPPPPRKWAMGDVAGAQAASGKAKNFAIWSAIAWVPFAILVIILRAAAGGLMDSSGI